MQSLRRKLSPSTCAVEDVPTAPKSEIHGRAVETAVPNMENYYLKLSRHVHEKWGKDMPNGEAFWFRIVKLAIWTAAILLFFRFLGYLVGGNFRDFWLVIATASTMFITFLIYLLKSFRLPDDAAGKPSALPVHVAEAGNAVAIATTGNGELMTDNNQDGGTKILHINHGTTFHNTPGGMMNFGHVTVTQHFETPQADPASPNEEPQKHNPEPAADDDVIDINGLIAYSVKVKSPGVSRNTIDKILREKNIKPCRIEKDGRAIRNLYPAKEAKAAIREYFGDKDN